MHTAHLHCTGRATMEKMSRRVVIAEGCIALLGVALIACAIAANQTWLDRHFLSDFFIPREVFVRTETNIRIAAAVLGVILALLVRRPLARFITVDPLRTLFVVAAIV